MKLLYFLVNRMVIALIIFGSLLHSLTKYITNNNFIYSGGYIFFFLTIILVFVLLFYKIKLLFNNISASINTLD